MKRIILTLVACLVIGVGTTNASFPVKKAKDSAQTELSSQDGTITPEKIAEAQKTFEAQMKEDIQSPEATSKFREEDWITLALWFFLGGLAAHRWYKKKPVGWNILFILTAGGCGIWAIVDLVHILQQDF
tara:strand:- start:6698 stop:7087 length:390 start_codon:yes stop_codon:yes gene_type:complete